MSDTTTQRARRLRLPSFSVRSCSASARHPRLGRLQMGRPRGDPNWLTTRWTPSAALFVTLLQDLVPPLVFTAIVASHRQPAPGHQRRPARLADAAVVRHHRADLRRHRHRPRPGHPARANTGLAATPPPSATQRVVARLPDRPRARATSSASAPTHVTDGGATTASTSTSCRSLVIAIAVGVAALQVGEGGRAVPGLQRAPPSPSSRRSSGGSSGSPRSAPSA